MSKLPMDAEDRIILEFGYKPQFKRVLGLFADFSLGYSYISHWPVSMPCSPSH
jgi:hypothetical protein